MVCNKETYSCLCLGIKGAKNSSMVATEAVDHALLIYDFDDQRVLLVYHGTDVGGGGTDTTRPIHEIL